MKVADLQKYLRALADAVGAAKGPNRELTEAADSLAPFGAHSVADFAKFLKLAEETYRDGKLPVKATPAPKAVKPPKPAPLTVEQLRAAIQSARERLNGTNPPNRTEVRAGLAPFEVLPKPILVEVVRELGYKSAVASKAVAIDRITERLTAAPVAAARSEA